MEGKSLLGILLDVHSYAGYTASKRQTDKEWLTRHDVKVSGCDLFQHQRQERKT
jgi:hypothetical protein